MGLWDALAECGSLLVDEKLYNLCETIYVGFWPVLYDFSASFAALAVKAGEVCLEYNDETVGVTCFVGGIGWYWLYGGIGLAACGGAIGLGPISIALLATAVGVGSWKLLKWLDHGTSRFFFLGGGRNEIIPAS